MRGFFWQFLRVKVSLGKFVLVKIRAVNRDYYRVGRVHEGFLVYKPTKHEKRISIPDSSVFYRSLGISWVDLDDEKNALVKPDFSTVTGFDAIKYNNLYLRALYSPKIADTMEKIIIGLLVLAVILIAINLFFTYNGYDAIGIIKQNIQSLPASVPAREVL